MRYTSAEKLEIIRLVEQSSLSVRRTLVQLDITKSTFYAWYRRYLDGGVEALEARKPVPRRVWNKVPPEITQEVLEIALEQPQLSPQELATAFTDQRAYFVSESTVDRLLKARDLITSPAFILMQAAERFSEPTTAIKQLWQTDFTYLKVIGWGWYYLSTVIDDYSRYIVAWKLCASMTAGEVLAKGGLTRTRRAIQADPPAGIPLESCGDCIKIRVRIQTVQPVAGQSLARGPSLPWQAHGLDGVAQHPLQGPLDDLHGLAGHTHHPGGPPAR